MELTIATLTSLADSLPWPWRRKRKDSASRKADAGSDTLETTPGGESPTQWVKVAENLQPVVASIIKGRLESVDIPAVIRQESIGSVMGLTVGPLGWSTVWVPEENAEAAFDLLAETFDHDELTEMSQTNPPANNEDVS